MIAVITGDIIGSRTQRNTQVWLAPLKEALNTMGTNPKTWEIFQGDSFQVELPAEKCLLNALYLKACIRVITGLDIRLAIGLGEKSHQSETIAEANGSAFIYSGETLKTLKSSKQNLAVKSAYPDFDETFNLMFKLALINLNSWTSTAAEIVKTSLAYPNLNQKKLGEKLGITQSSVSQRQKTAAYSELMALNAFFVKKLNQLSAS